MATKPDVRVRRLSDKTEGQDGDRVSADHIWPRGAKQGQGGARPVVQGRIAVNGAAQALQPRPDEFEEFTRRCRVELDDSEPAEALQHLRELDTGHRLRLLTATKNPHISEPAVLCDLLRR